MGSRWEKSKLKSSSGICSSLLTSSRNHWNLYQINYSHAYMYLFTHKTSKTLWLSKQKILWFIGHKRKSQQPHINLPLKYLSLSAPDGAFFFPKDIFFSDIKTFSKNLSCLIKVFVGFLRELAGVSIPSLSYFYHWIFSQKISFI